MKPEPVQIPTRSGVTLNGIVRKLAGRGPFPAVVFVSGFGMNFHESGNSYDEISKHLVAQNFATVQFNFSGVDSASRMVNELPLGERAAELDAVLAHIRNQPFIDASRVGILAQSFGVPTTLCSNLHNIASTVCLSGVYILKDHLKEELRKDSSLKEMREMKGKTEFHDYDGKVVVVDQDFWQSIDGFDPIAKVRRLATPVMIIHGDQDSYTPAEEVRQVFEAIPSKNKKLKIFAGGDHGIVDVPRVMREEMLQEVVEWFNKTL